MPKNQALADNIRRAKHDNLVKELRLRQRNIVFPDTVRNEGAFYRNLAGQTAHAYTSYRVFAVFFGLFMLLSYLVVPFFVGAIKAVFSFQSLDWFGDLAWIVASSLWIAVALKITVNALVQEDQQPQPRPPKAYPRVKI
jgi:hypothetical protein